MPYVLPSRYRAPSLLTNAHLQTVYATKLRRVAGVHYVRERIDTPDGDFLDLDWSYVSEGPIAILVHGYEGNSKQSYMLGMTRALNRRGINVVCLNLRGCSGELNRKLSTYHSGATVDLETVSTHVEQKHPGQNQYFIGFSLGGNLVLKYLGELGSDHKAIIRGGVAFSVPCNLNACAAEVHATSNRLYFHYLVAATHFKLKEKARRFPGQVHPKALEWPSSFRDLDEYYTAPVFGFSSAEDYWEKASCLTVLDRIRVPTLLVNARDDPLISRAGLPIEIAAESDYFYLEVPEHGGHVGFVSLDADGEFWSEARAIAFLFGL